MSSAYSAHLDRVLATANFGEPVEVWKDEDGTWQTPFGVVVRASTVGATGIGVGPVILIRRVPETLQVLGRPPARKFVKTKLRFDGEKRLYLTAIAENGTWVWRVYKVADGCRLAKGHEMFVGVWRD